MSKQGERNVLFFLRHSATNIADVFVGQSLGIYLLVCADIDAITKFA